MDERIEAALVEREVGVVAEVAANRALVGHVDSGSEGVPGPSTAGGRTSRSPVSVCFSRQINHSLGLIRPDHLCASLDVGADAR